MYQIHAIVSDLTKVAKHTDRHLSGCGSVVIEPEQPDQQDQQDQHEQTIWVANSGNGCLQPNVTQYDLHGHHLRKPLPFIDLKHNRMTSQPAKIQLISDLLWLQKTVLYNDQGIIMPMPTIYTTAPILGTPDHQPSTYEVSLNAFLSGPNGYLGPDLSYLINHCINYPYTVVSSAFTTYLSNAHQTYLILLRDLHDKITITQYSNYLIQAQDEIPTSVPVSERQNDESSKTVEISHKDEFSPYPAFNPRLPIGLVYNSTRGFVRTYLKDSDGYAQSDSSTSADFIAATSTGRIYAYHQSINIGNNYGFISIIDDTDDHSVYTGLTMTNNNLYLADFANLRIRVYNYKWENLRDLDEHGFRDPDLPPNYSPFNVQAINGRIYVLYAQLNMADLLTVYDVVAGHGLGLISVFRPDGSFIKRVVSHDHLNAPWGLTFMDNKFFVANHGNGHIHAYDDHWKHLGRIHFTEHDSHHVYNQDQIYQPFGLTTLENKIYGVSRPKDTHGLLYSLKKK